MGTDKDKVLSSVPNDFISSRVNEQMEDSAKKRRLERLRRNTTFPNVTHAEERRRLRGRLESLTAAVNAALGELTEGSSP